MKSVTPHRLGVLQDNRLLCKLPTSRSFVAFLFCVRLSVSLILLPPWVQASSSTPRPIALFALSPPTSRMGRASWLTLTCRYTPCSSPVNERKTAQYAINTDLVAYLADCCILRYTPTKRNKNNTNFTLTFGRKLSNLDQGIRLSRDRYTLHPRYKTVSLQTCSSPFPQEASKPCLQQLFIVDRPTLYILQLPTIRHHT